MDSCSSDLLVLILEWLPPLELLQSALYVAKGWAPRIQARSFWLNHPLLLTLPHWGDIHNHLTLKQLQKLCMCVAARDDLPSFLQLESILFSHDEAMAIRHNSRYACVASTTDRLQEGIENLLQSGRENEGSLYARKWWSSRPSITKETDETLLFITRNPMCVVTSFSISPLRDPYFARLQSQYLVYTWKHTIVRAYFLPLESYPADEEDDILFDSRCGVLLRPTPDGAPSHQGAIDALLRDAELIYESQKCECPVHSDDTLTFHMPPGIIANIISVSLIGKHHEQRSGMGYFCCVSNVACVGISL